MKYKIALDQGAVAVILNSLGNQPYGQVKGLLESLQKNAGEHFRKSQDGLDLILDDNAVNVVMNSLAASPYNAVAGVVDYIQKNIAEISEEALEQLIAESKALQDSQGAPKLAELVPAEPLPVPAEYAPGELAPEVPTAEDAPVATVTE